MNLSFKSIFLLPLILLFFPAFCVWLFVKPIVIYFIVVIAVFALTFFLKPKFLYSNLRILYKISAFKYFLFFSLWCISSGIILVIFGKYKLNIYIYYLFSLLLVDYGMTYVLPFFAYRKQTYDIRFFAKLLMIIYFIIFIIGILEFFGKTFNIEALTFFSNFLGNQRLLDITNIEDGYINRVRSVFAEPGWLGGFIFLNMPIIYSLARSKYKIFETKFLNLIIKRTIIPIMWFVIFVEQSAIWLIFNIILTLIYFRRNIKHFFVKHFIKVISILLIFIIMAILILSSGNIVDLGFYNRIFKFLINVNNFGKLVAADPSLGCRLVSYVITIKIGIHNWLLGIGLGNTSYVFPHYYAVSKLPFVGELEANFVKYSLETAKMNFNSAIPYELFADTGIIGISLFYLFIFKTIKFLNKVKKYFYGIEYDFVQGLGFAITAIPIIIFYDIPIAYYYIWFLFGLINIFIYKAYQTRNIKRIKNK